MSNKPSSPISIREKRKSAQRRARLVWGGVFLLVLAGAALFLVYTSLKPARKVPPGPPNVDPSIVTITTASGLQYQDVRVGDGAEAKAGDTVSVHYTGWLSDGSQFDSSYERNNPFTFTLGAGRVIRGWDEGVAGMKVGGKRRLIIPPELGYGEAGMPPDIPPNATLIFDIELLAIQ